MSFNPPQFAEKYRLALESAEKQNPNGGLNGFELEWNLLEEQFHPLFTVGSGSRAKNEQHFIPSIEPYYRALNELANNWK